MKGLIACLLLLFAPIIATAGGEEENPLFLRAKAQGERDGYGVITTPMLRELLKQDPDVLLVDVRYAYEYEAGHIPGAVSLPVDLQDRTDLSAERRQAYTAVLGEDRNRPLVIYCRGFRWLLGEIAAAWAVRLGYTKVSRYPAGYEGWNR